VELDIEKEIESITTQLIEKYCPEKIFLFGSAAQGDRDQVNDLDFLIIKQDVPFYGIDRMRELDELIERNMAADMLVYRPAFFFLIFDSQNKKGGKPTKNLPPSFPYASCLYSILLFYPGNAERRT